MSRLFDIEHEDQGGYRIQAILTREDGSWSDPWHHVQSEDYNWLTRHFSRVDRSTYEDALHGHTLPLIQALGRPPEGCLAKITRERLQCLHHDTCPMYDKEACFGHRTPPACFEAGSQEHALGERDVLTHTFGLWRRGAHIIVVSTWDEEYNLS